MWHIIRDKNATRGYLVIRETNGHTDRLLRTSDGECWTSDLIYGSCDKDDFPDILDKFLEENNYYILHSFESDNPIKYLQTIRDTNPEFFI